MTRLLVLLLTLAAAALPLTACGAEDIEPDAVAAAATRTAGTTGMKVDADVRAEAAGQEFAFTMEGAVSPKEQRAQFDIDMSSLARLSAGRLDPDELRGEERLIGTTVYMRLPAFTKALGAEWIKIDVDKALAGSGVDLGGLQSLSNQSPAEQLKMLRATSDIEEVGKEDVDGVRTTHYKGTLRFRDYPKLVPKAERADAQRGIDALIKAGAPETTPVEVWVDDGDLVRREKLTMKMRTGGQTATSEIDMRFSDFGRDVEVTAPDDADVKDLTELASQGVGQSAGG